MRNALKLAAALHALCAIAFAVPQQTPEQPIRQIVLASEPEAIQTRASLIAGASFEALAAERSRDATSARGGYMGRMRLSDLRSEVRAAIESVKPGEITNPVHLGNAYVLFQIVPEAESRWIDFDEAGARALADGRRDEAIAHFEQALAQAEAVALGDARLARSLDSLAAAYHLEGRVGEAEKLYRRALALLERMGAPELEIAQVLSGLGMALVKQARFNDAEPFYDRARSIREKRLGPEHPEVAATLHNIAELSELQGRFVEAAKLYDQSHFLFERTLGTTHPATVASALRRDAFRKSLVSELLERASIAASLLEFRDPEFMAGIRELLPLASLSEDAYLQIKDILLMAGLSAETEDILRTGLKKFPASRILRIYLADLLAGTGRTQDALSLLQETSRLARPEEVDAATERQQLGIIYQRIGDMQSGLTNLSGALASYLRALEIDPTSPSGRVKLGKAYFSMGRLEEAQAEFERAARETPDDGDAYLILAETHLARGQWERAATAAERAIELNVSDSRALYLLGTAMVRTGRAVQGQEHLREFARVEGSFLSAEQRNREIIAVNIAAAAALRDGDGDSALQQLTQGIMRHPDADGLRMNLAIVQSRLGRHDKAIETLESMLKLGIGRSFLIHKTLADEYEIAGDTEASRRHRQIYLDTRAADLIVDPGK